MNTPVGSHKALISACICLGFTLNEIVSYIDVDIKLIAASVRHRQLRATPCAYLLARVLLLAWSIESFVHIYLVVHGHRVNMVRFRRLTMMLLSLDMVASTAILALRTLVLQTKRARKRLMAIIISVLLMIQLGAGFFAAFTFVSNPERNLNLAQKRVHLSINALCSTTLALDVVFAAIIITFVLRKERRVRSCRVMRMLLRDATVYVSLSAMVNIATVIALNEWRDSLANTIILLCANVALCVAIACRIFRSQLAFFKALPRHTATSAGLAALEPSRQEGSPARPAFIMQGYPRSPQPPLQLEEGGFQAGGCAGQSDRDVDSLASSRVSCSSQPPIKLTPPTTAVGTQTYGLDPRTDQERRASELSLDDFVMVSPRDCKRFSASQLHGHRRSFPDESTSGVEEVASPQRMRDPSMSSSATLYSDRWNGQDDEGINQPPPGLIPRPCQPVLRDDVHRPRSVAPPDAPRAAEDISHRHAADVGSFAPSPLLQPWISDLRTQGVSSTAALRVDASSHRLGARGDSSTGGATPREPAFHSSDLEITPGASPAPIDFGDQHPLSGRLTPWTSRNSSTVSASRRGSEAASIFLSLPARSSAESVIDDAIELGSRMVVDPASGRYVVRPQMARSQPSQSTIVPRRPERTRFGLTPSPEETGHEMSGQA